MERQEQIERLATLAGIEPEYHDIFGNLHPTPLETKEAILKAMRFPIDNGGALSNALDVLENTGWRHPLGPVQVQNEDEGVRVVLSLPQHHLGDAHHWRLIEETGLERTGELTPADLDWIETRTFGETIYEKRALALDPPPRPGYHRLEISGPGVGDSSKPSTLLIVTPATCHRPLALREEGRIWGMTAQLYSLRSERNWGAGDFTDLKTLIDHCGELGGEIVSLNPVHALFPHNPHHISPYSPSSRLFRNIFYIDVEAVPEFRECEEAQLRVTSPEFQSRLHELRSAEKIDYPGVAAAKREILESLYAYFRTRHLDRETDRGRAFRSYQEKEGESLWRHCLYEAIQEHFHREDPRTWGWQVWPEVYRDPESDEVGRFGVEHGDRVEFYVYLQWEVERQLDAAGRRSEVQRLGVGICEDLAVGIDRAGGEAWANQKLFALDVSVGAPPDSFNVEGQDWGLPPYSPVSLRQLEYRPFIEMLRRNMRHAGGLRIDHILGLMRQFWVPQGMSARHGAYVRFPFEDLLGILALESQRNGCIVIGEDLGTIPDGLREALMVRGVLSYRVLFFEHDDAGNSRPPSEYPEQATVAISTHDLPTLAGYWQGRDLAIHDEIGLFEDEAQRDEQVMARARDRARLLMALGREDLLPEGLTVDPASAPEMTPELSTAIHTFLARSPSRVFLVQVTDLLGECDPVNVPSGAGKYPNWRQKHSVSLEVMGSDPWVQRIAQAISAERPRSWLRRLDVDPSIASPNHPVIPRATYRLQFNRAFTFIDAIAIVPYLSELGISHVYTSPYLRARPGSSHGYDIIDHNAVNPEIGSGEDYERFIETLRAHKMGQILDIVPNHMGVGGNDNAWWMDVLENGQASEYAPFFDIDWQPIKPELQRKILLPFLGDHYGEVLNSGHLKLRFDAPTGSFSIDYYEYSFPVDPRTYPAILKVGLDRIEVSLGAKNPTLMEFQSLIVAFGHLPPHTTTDTEAIKERNRDKEVHKRKLAALCRTEEGIARSIEEAVEIHNDSNPAARGTERIHRLLESQAYRLANWRVAADEINYRRFFDVNNLAGLRMEHPVVFEATHRLIFDLIATGKADGVRVDHPDGLYDPGHYFRRLQARSAEILGIPIGRISRNEDASRPVYSAIEKILAPYERLREDWPVHGTTGYDVSNLVNGLFVYPESEKELSKAYSRFIEKEINIDDLIYDCKKLIIRTALASELNVLTNLLDQISESDRSTRDFTRIALHDALAEVVACFPVYRTYVTEQGIREEDRRYIDWAIAQAKKRSPATDLTIFDFIREVLLLQRAGEGPDYRKRVLRFAMKFQQYTAPVMAKGVEDTAFYRYHRLISLNEVGGDPARFGISKATLHQANAERARRWPHAMLAGSTHDSKRSEDVRARINLLSEMPGEWSKRLAVWRRLNRSRKRLVDGLRWPDRNDEYLLYQTLIGTWPLGELNEDTLGTYRDRIEAYMLKAIREAKVHTSWINPNEEYEGAVRHFIRRLLFSPEKNRFIAEFLPFQEHVSRLGMFNSLSQLILRLTSPGVPDLYQGSLEWEYTLVDPDNRRPIDYDRLHDRLRTILAKVNNPEIDRRQFARSLLDQLEDGGVKQFVGASILGLRKDLPALFRDGSYLPLEIEGSRHEHLFAFARQEGDRTLVVAVPRWFARLGLDAGALPIGMSTWNSSSILLPTEIGDRKFRNVLTGSIAEADPRDHGSALPAGTVLADFPVAVLVSDESING